MVKDCKVIINNDAVTVFRFDSSCVQVPSIGRNAETVRVLYKDGKYTVVDDDYVEINVKEKKKKKTTVDTSQSVNEIQSNTEIDFGIE